MIRPALNGHLVGYAHVSTDDQDLTLQIDSLVGLGVNRDDIFTDKISGAKTERPGLDACLARLQHGDTLVVWRLDVTVRPTAGRVRGRFRASGWA